jgi:uncharacterized protein YcaQ
MTAVPQLTWAQVRAWRLSHHHLDRRVPKSKLLEIVCDVCGIHAQVASSSDLQLWSRVEGVSPDDIRAALWEHRTLVRTWSLRGTLHLHTADDLPVYVAALSQHDRWWKGAWLRMIEMTEEELRAALDAIRKSLGARPVTREQLAEKVAAKVGAKGRERMLSGWGEMLKPAAFLGHLCSGPPRGQNVTFVRPDRWLGKWKVPAPEAAWKEIVRRYLRAYGPASREDFARWWGMQPAPAGRVLKAFGDELTEVNVEGHRAWILTEDLPALRKSKSRPPVRLLAGFDVYVVGTRPRESLVEKRYEPRVFRQAGWISPVVLIDGTAAGVWKHERRSDRVDITVTPFRKLSAAHRKAIKEEGDRLGRFLDAPASVTFAT